MTQSDLTLTINWPARQFVSGEGTSADRLTFVLGDKYRMALVLQDRNSSGTVKSLNDLPIRTIRASLGRSAAPPTAGTFKLAKDTVDTAALDFDVSAAALQTALGAAEVILAASGCWLVRFAAATDLEVSATAGSNALGPLSFIRVRPYSMGDYDWYEVKLIQIPWAFASNHTRVLGEAPEVSRIRGGIASAPGIVKQNEIQAIKVPVNFEGTYFIEWNYRTSVILGVQDSLETIAAALNGMFTDGEERFVVSNPENEKAYVEFVGELAEAPQSLMVTRVNTFTQGVPTLVLDLATSELAAALRATAKLEKVPFELEFEVMDSEEDLEDPFATGRIITVQTEVTCVREQIFPELAAVPAIDWLRPPQPKDYQPFTLDQVITGIQHNVSVRGNDVARTFVVDHGLGTENLLPPAVLRKDSGDLVSRLLILGLDYVFEIVDEDQVEIILLAGATTPSTNALKIIITTAGPVSAFQSHTHTIAQIVGLQDALDTLGGQVADLLDLVPSGALVSETAASGAIIAQWTLPKIGEVYPIRKDAPEITGTISDIDQSKLPRAGGLLNALHNTLIEALGDPIPEPSDSFIGHLYQNQTGDNVDLAGGGGRRSVVLADDEFAACDGRYFYKIERRGETSSYFPTDFERELFMFAVNDKQLRLKKTLQLEFGFEVAVLKSNTRAQWILVIEHGVFTQASAVGGESTNLGQVTWNTTPMLRQPLIVTPVPCVHKFGAVIQRQLVSSVDTVSANVIRYGAEEVSGSVPTSANFAIRARLIDFDTEDNKPDPKGFIALVGLASDTSETASENIGIATIK